MKIVLATGIFFPNVGGPATHVRRIALALHNSKVNAVVIAYGDHPENQFPFRVRRISRKYPGLVRWGLYFLTVLREGWNADTIYAFDITAAGMPAFVASRILFKRFLLRIGGDPIWERVVEQGKRFLTIHEYYDQKLAQVDRPLLFRMIRLMLRYTSTIVTYNNLLKNLYLSEFGVRPEQVKIIKNPMMSHQKVSPLPSPPVFLFAGRFVSYKNLPLVISAFDSLWQKYKSGRLELVGDGPDEKSLKSLVAGLPSSSVISFITPLSQQELFSRISQATVCLAPALTEFNPNFILEGISFGRPTIITRGNGLTVDIPTDWQFDPKSLDSLTEAMSRWYDSAFVEKAKDRMKKIPLSVTWEDVVKEQLKLLNVNV